ncbi:SnoaL-like protein [Orenia metallireducens]|uniref:SnoaL-like domain-containing protein n=1 Tax=Orenia metallireducens TaxID=1413210 RepID=A0A285IIJ0_9FIRM|nr:nuclear transport factor 2 family protein [Orenia metallireducens]PRX16939.1 SnoaL-like protein [Orenia metallireducens]SNY47782.1 SnoaL-like domain-containing protein [Orenia metallireducens]
MNEYEKIVKKFWNCFDNGNFDETKKYLEANIIVRWPNTREIFRDRDSFVLVNKKYPGRWRIRIEKLISKGDEVVSVVKVESEDRVQSFYATSFFSFEDGLISEITEYWGNNGEPPEWRIKEKLSERY